MADKLETRLRSLEEEIFYQVDLKLMEKLRTDTQQEEKRQQLSKLMHVEDKATLDELIEQGIDQNSVAALLLVPLAVVAWADGRITDEERSTVIDIAAKYAKEDSGPFIDVVKHWLKREPSEALWNAWLTYVRTLREQSLGPATEMLSEKLIDHARKVAEASHSFLSFKRINAEKQQALDRVCDALRSVK
jgi:hypothetical protein